MSFHDTALHAALPDGQVLTYTPHQRDDAQALIAAHMPLVRKLAWHVHGRVATAIEVEDLVQIGMVALIEAARGYQDRGHAFATYASTRIRGAMIDSLRRVATEGRSGIAKRRALDAARAAFARSYGRAPSHDELAASMGIGAGALHELIEAAQSLRHESIDDLYSDHSMWFADGREAADDAIDRNQLQDALTHAIATLPPREAMVLQLYFVEEMNLDEIGATLGVGAARVCQIKKAALDKVRGMLGEGA